MVPLLPDVEGRRVDEVELRVPGRVFRRGRGVVPIARGGVVPGCLPDRVPVLPRVPYDRPGRMPEPERVELEPMLGRVLRVPVLRVPYRRVVLPGVVVRVRALPPIEGLGIELRVGRDVRPVLGRVTRGVGRLRVLERILERVEGEGRVTRGDVRVGREMPGDRRVGRLVLGVGRLGEGRDARVDERVGRGVARRGLGLLVRTEGRLGAGRETRGEERERGEERRWASRASEPSSAAAAMRTDRMRMAYPVWVETRRTASRIPRPFGP